jgi:hypothetical protein
MLPFEKFSVEAVDVGVALSAKKQNSFNTWKRVQNLPV